jgi:very-short-patch-repair endonuclease
MSFPEVLLWRKLRKDQSGFRFRRQHPVGAYVLDFYCPELKLAVEIDGSLHYDDAAVAYDKRRDTWLRGQGIHVLRLPARVVFENMDSALMTIAGVAGS